MSNGKFVGNISISVNGFSIPLVSMYERQGTKGRFISCSINPTVSIEQLIAVTPATKTEVGVAKFLNAYLNLAEGVTISTDGVSDNTTETEVEDDPFDIK